MTQFIEVCVFCRAMRARGARATDLSLAISELRCSELRFIYRLPTSSLFVSRLSRGPSSSPVICSIEIMEPRKPPFQVEVCTLVLQERKTLATTTSIGNR